MSNGAETPPAAAAVPGGEARGAPAPVLELAEAYPLYVSRRAKHAEAVKM